MALPLPTSLSPSRVSSFTDCALKFKYSAIDRMQEPPSEATARGTLVHRALERLHAEVPAGKRTPTVALDLLWDSAPEVLDGDEYGSLSLPDRDGFIGECEPMVHNSFLLEDPNEVNAIGLELFCTVELGGLKLRGIIDRLDKRDEDRLVIVDYKTGRAPGPKYEHSKMVGIHFYAYMVEQLLGVRPASIELHFLREPVVISTTPSDQAIRQLQRKTTAVWSAIEKACATDDFRPRKSKLCNYCAFHGLCPAWQEETSGIGIDASAVVAMR